MVGLCGAVHKIDGSHYCDRVYVALVPEVISYGEYTHGKRISGIVNALTGIFYKAGMALGGVVPGLVMAFVGFDQTNEVSQSPFAEQGILCS